MPAGKQLDLSFLRGSEWVKTTLGAVTASAVDGPFGSNLKTEHYVSEPGVRVVRLQNVGEGAFDDGDKVWISERHAQRLSRHDIVPGDMLVASLGDDNHPVARACLFPEDHPPGIVKADCFRLRLNLREAWPGYVMRVLNCPNTRTGIGGLSQGVTRDRINLGNLLQFTYRHPLVSAQRVVADVLDSVDDVIRTTKQLVAKLQGMKQGLLRDLLTRGVDDNGELRDPERHPERFREHPLGAIPYDWAWARLGDLAEIAGGVTLGRSLPGTATLELPYLRVANVQDGRLDLAEVKTVRVLRSEERRFRLEVGDVLMNEGGDFDKLGRGTVWEGQIERCLHQNHVFRVRSRRSVLKPWFLAAVSESSIGKSYFLRASKQTTNLATINSRQVHAFPVPLPPASEQDRIVQILDTSRRRIESELEDLTKLRALKQGLMDDLLTGRIRVPLAPEPAP